MCPKTWWVHLIIASAIPQAPKVMVSVTNGYSTNGYPPNHPFVDWIFQYKPYSYWGIIQIISRAKSTLKCSQLCNSACGFAAIFRVRWALMATGPDLFSALILKKQAQRIFPTPTTRRKSQQMVVGMILLLNSGCISTWYSQLNSMFDPHQPEFRSERHGQTMGARAFPHHLVVKGGRHRPFAIFDHQRVDAHCFRDFGTIAIFGETCVECTCVKCHPKKHDKMQRTTQEKGQLSIVHQLKLISNQR